MAKRVLTGDGKGAVKSVKDLNKAFGETEKAIGLTVKEAAQLEKKGKRIAELADPQKRYNRQMAELARLVKEGKLSMADAEKVAEKYRKRLDNIGRSSKKAFDVDGMKQYILGVFGVAAAIRTATKLFTEMETAAQGAADTAFAAIAQQGELQQLAPEDLAANNALAKRMVSEGIFSPAQRGQAYATAFNLNSAGLTPQEKEVLLSAGKAGTIAPGGLVTVGGRIKKAQTIFKGEAGTYEEVLDKVAFAAGKTLSDVATISGAIPQFAQEAKSAGIGFDETVAAFIAVEQESATSEIAATRFRGLLSRLAKSDLVVGGDLTDSMEAIQARVQGGEKLSSIVPDIRGLAAASSIIENLATVSEYEKGVAGSSGLMVERGGGLARIDPLFEAGKLKQKAVGALDISMEREATKETLFDVLRARRAEEAGGGMLGAVSNIGMAFMDAFGLEEFAMAGATRTQGLLSEEEQKAFTSYLQQQTESLQQIEQNQRTGNPQGRQE